jgi:hypothetical protein
MTIITDIIKFEYPMRYDDLDYEKQMFLIPILFKASILGFVWPAYLLTAIIFLLK